MGLLPSCLRWPFLGRPKGDLPQEPAMLRGQHAWEKTDEDVTVNYNIFEKLCLGEGLFFPLKMGV